MNKLIILRETTWQSFVTDTFTFGCIAVLLWANYRFFGDHVAITIILAIAGLLVPISHRVKKEEFTDVESAKKCIEDFFKQNEK